MMILSVSCTKRLATLFAASVLILHIIGVQSGECYDNKDYRYYGDHWKDCGWIAKNDRCDRVKNGQHVGKEYCPYSCGYCSGGGSDGDRCYDDLGFRYMKIDDQASVEG
jgi:hypothetical protein